MEVRELNDSYVLFIDVPGFSRNDVTVTVEGDILFISASHKTSSGSGPVQVAGPSKDLVVERPRGGVKRTWRLPNDSLLDGIHAKVNNGELVIIVPKRKAFTVPVLGADSEPAQLTEPAKEPLTTPEPVPTSTETPAEQPAAVQQPAAVEPATPVGHVPEGDATMADAEESDGSWQDLSDEEREAGEAARRAKGKLPLEGPVLEEIERQEAEMRAQQQHDNDSD